MTTKDLRPGVLVRIRRSTDGVDVDLYIREVKDGRVVFARSPSGEHGGRWWLPVELVLERGQVIAPPAAPGPRAAKRRGRPLSPRTLQILERLRSGRSQASIATEFGCTHQNVSLIKRRAEKREPVVHQHAG